MQEPFIPEGYQRCMPYLMLPDAAGFFSFMENLFDATEKMRHLTPDGALMHGELQVGDSTFMYSESSAEWGTQAGGFYIHVADADASYARALALGCTAIQPPTDQPYGRSGGVKDPFGNTWWITTTQPSAPKKDQ
jgi:uncharacterized glyoxalase superfamily protein PhnB